MAKKLVLCDCLGSQTVDADAISAGSGLGCSRLYTSLCVDQIDLAAKEIFQGEVIIACQQERQRFEELAAELEVEAPAFVCATVRDGAKATPRPRWPHWQLRPRYPFRWAAPST